MSDSPRNSRFVGVSEPSNLPMLLELTVEQVAMGMLLLRTCAPLGVLFCRPGAGMGIACFSGCWLPIRQRYALPVVNVASCRDCVSAPM